MNAQHRWTEAEKDVVRKGYDGTKSSIEAMAAQLNMTFNAVKSQVQTLDLFKRKKEPDWTEDELEYLGTHYGLVPDEQICNHLGRSQNGIVLAAKRYLHINRKMNFLTGHELARVFGIPCSKTITQTWVRKGFIKGRKSPTHCGKTKMWCFTEDDALKCLKARPWLVDLRRMEDHNSYRQIIEAEWKRDPWYQPVQAARMLGMPYSRIMKELKRGRIEADKKPGASWAGEWIIRRSGIQAYLEKRVGGMSLCTCGHAYHMHHAGQGKCYHGQRRRWVKGTGMVASTLCRCRSYKPTNQFSFQRVRVTAIQWYGDNVKQLCRMLPPGMPFGGVAIVAGGRFGFELPHQGGIVEVQQGDWLVKTPGGRFFTLPSDIFLELFYAKGERTQLWKHRTYTSTQPSSPPPR